MPTTPHLPENAHIAILKMVVLKMQTVRVASASASIFRMTCEIQQI